MKGRPADLPLVQVLARVSLAIAERDAANAAARLRPKDPEWVISDEITGPALRGLRASAFVSIRDLARVLAISEQRLGRIERSQRLETATVRRYLAAVAQLVAETSASEPGQRT